jgi:hypothetical protein
VTNADRRRTTLEALERQILSVNQDLARMSGSTLSGFATALEVHAREVRARLSGTLAVRGAASGSAAAIAEHALARACPVILTRFAALLPITADDHPATRDANEATAVEYAEAIAAMAGWEAAVGPDTRLRTAIQHRLSTIAQTCRSCIEGHLHAGSDTDIPDVRQLAVDILRVEAVEWVIEIAGGSSHSEQIRLLTHRAARQSVVWAGVVFERFKIRPDEMSHFDAVATLSAVDDLLVVILRVLQSDRDERRSGSHPFVLTIGEQAMQDFVNGLRHMTGRYLDIAEQHLLSAGAAGDFAQSVLRVLHRVLLFGHALLASVELVDIRLNHETALTRMVGMRAKLQASLDMPGASERYLTRLQVLDVALRDVGA